MFVRQSVGIYQILREEDFRFLEITGYRIVVGIVDLLRTSLRANICLRRYDLG
jgi:hypothetical protein